MRNVLVTMLAMTAAFVFADEAGMPDVTYPLQGIPFHQYSNMCRSIFHQLLEHASILVLSVYTTDKVVVATTAEPTDGETNKVSHVFSSEGSDWKHTRSVPRGQSTFPGLTAHEIQDLLVSLSAEIGIDERILSFCRRTVDQVEIMTGGHGGRLAGKGDGFIFRRVDDKWIFEKKVQWVS